MGDEDWDALEETLQILGDVVAMRDLAEAERQVAAGELLNAEQLRRWMAERGARRREGPIR